MGPAYRPMLGLNELLGLLRITANSTYSPISYKLQFHISYKRYVKRNNVIFTLSVFLIVDKDRKQDSGVR